MERIRLYDVGACDGGDVTIGHRESRGTVMIIDESSSIELPPTEARRLRDWLTEWLERYGDTP